MFITLLMRWPVRSWKLQASKIATTLFLDILAEQLLLVGRDVLGQRGGGLVDRLDSLENLLGGLFGAADDGAEFAIDLGHFLAVKAGAVQGCDFALGAVDRVVNEVEFDLQLLALLDLGAVGFQQRLGVGNLAVDLRGNGRGRGIGRGGAGRADGCHLRPDGAQLGHDLAMHRSDLAAFDRHGNGSVAQNGLFDTKTLASNRHEFFPTPLNTWVSYTDAI